MSTSAAGGIRTESDAFGNIDVEGSRYWGAQTQRSLQNFPIGGRESRMPIEVIKGTRTFFDADTEVPLDPCARSVYIGECSVIST